MADQIYVFLISYTITTTYTTTFPLQTQYLSPLFSCKSTSLTKSLHLCFHQQPASLTGFNHKVPSGSSCHLPCLAFGFFNSAYSFCEST